MNASRQRPPPASRATDDPHAQHGAALLAVLAIIGLGASAILLNAVTHRVRPAMKADMAAATALGQARDALIGYAVIHSRLPYPARPETASGTVYGGITAGMEEAGRTFGVLPWATLGLPETDSHGRRFSYRVTPVFATPPPTPPVPAFDAATPGDITILDRLGGTAVAGAVPAVIVYHGGNGLNAWLSPGDRMPASADPDENANDAADTVFISKTRNESFDDSLMWIDRTLLIDRLIKAGRLPTP